MKPFTAEVPNELAICMCQWVVDSVPFARNVGNRRQDRLRIEASDGRQAHQAHQQLLPVPVYVPGCAPGPTAHILLCERTTFLAINAIWLVSGKL